MSLKIEHAHLVLPYQVLQDAWLISREGKITAYGCGVSPQQTFSTVIDAKGQYLTPGFVDLHVHGGAGADFRDGEEAAFVRAMQAHLAGDDGVLTHQTGNRLGGELALLLHGSGYFFCHCSPLSLRE